MWVIMGVVSFPHCGMVCSKPYPLNKGCGLPGSRGCRPSFFTGFHCSFDGCYCFQRFLLFFLVFHWFLDGFIDLSMVFIDFFTVCIDVPWFSLIPQWCLSRFLIFINLFVRWLSSISWSFSSFPCVLIDLSMVFDSSAVFIHFSILLIDFSMAIIDFLMAFIDVWVAVG